VKFHQALSNTTLRSEHQASQGLKMSNNGTWANYAGKGRHWTLPIGDISISIIAEALSGGNIHYDPQNQYGCIFSPKRG
jgi:hypothetical protein